MAAESPKENFPAFKEPHTISSYKYYNVSTGKETSASSIKTGAKGSKRLIYFYQPELRIAGPREAIDRYIYGYRHTNPATIMKLEDALRRGEYIHADNLESFSSYIADEIAMGKRLLDSVKEDYLILLNSIRMGGGAKKKESDEPKSPRSVRSPRRPKGNLANLIAEAIKTDHGYIDVSVINPAGEKYKSLVKLHNRHYFNPDYPHVVTKELSSLDKLENIIPAIPGWSRELIAGYAPYSKEAAAAAPAPVVQLPRVSAPVVQLPRAPAVPSYPSIPTGPRRL